ncbi:hypothetical protein ABEB36_013380 [Hypothenemus hampei]|uniref:Uncharacterized protein n=1 Tax=Hypothenemus hampei TaxID=57062 RepID=A0ABD1E7U3_HYPHA
MPKSPEKLNIHMEKHFKSKSKRESSSKDQKDENDEGLSKIKTENKSKGKRERRDRKNKSQKVNEEKTRTHHSLEKKKSGFLAKTKLLFRKEKSFNDAIKKTKDLEKDTSTRVKQHKHKHNERPGGNENISTHHKCEKRLKKPRSNSADNPNQYINGQPITSVQEVIFCHMNQQLPHKTKNNAGNPNRPVKGLFETVVAEEKQSKKKCHSRGVESKNLLNQEFILQPETTLRKANRRCKERYNTTQQTLLGQEECLTSYIYPDFNMEVGHKGQHLSSNVDKCKNASEFNLGPYNFTILNGNIKKHKSRRGSIDYGSKSVDRNQQLCNKKAEKRSEKEAFKLDEKQIHKIIEGDLKNHFCQIQTLINEKFDALLKMKMEKHRKAKREIMREHERTRLKEELNDSNTDLNADKPKIEMFFMNQNINSTPLKHQPDKHSSKHIEKPYQKSATTDRQRVHRKNHHHESPSRKHPDHYRKSSEDKETKTAMRYVQSPKKLWSLLQDSIKNRTIAKNEENTSKQSLSEQQLGHQFKHNMYLYSASEHSIIRTKNFGNLKRSASPELLHPVKQNEDCKNWNQNETFLKEIFLPPEDFRYNDVDKRPRQEIIVQGNESLFLEVPITTNSKKPRKLECKIVSIIEVPPQESNYSKESTSMTEQNLKEKQKDSKRFQLYCKYSSKNDKPEVNECSSNGRSVISDNSRIVNDPSEERINKKNRKGLHSKSIIPLYLPKNLHQNLANLNNIIEESTNVSVVPSYDTKYFVPLPDSTKYYCRILSNSHSDYCFKMNRKSSNLNISLHQSRNKSRNLNQNLKNQSSRKHLNSCKSKTDINSSEKPSKQPDTALNSEIFLNTSTGELVLKPNFITTPRKRKQFTFQTAYREKDFPDSVFNNFESDDEEVDLFKSDHGRFDKIHETIDSLEEKIHNIRRTPPKTKNATVSVNSWEFNNAKRKASIRKVHVATSDSTAINNKKVLDAAVGLSRINLASKPTNTPQKIFTRPPEKVSIALSPIRLNQDEPVPKVRARSPSRPRKTPVIRSGARPRNTRSIRESTIIEYYPSTSKLEENKFSNVIIPKGEEKRTSYKSNSQNVAVKTLQGSLTPRFNVREPVTTKPAPVVKVFRSCEKKIESSLMEKNAEREHCFHNYMHGSTKIPNNKIKTNNNNVIIGLATINHHAAIEKFERSTSSSLLEPANRPLTKSKSLIGLRISETIKSTVKKSNSECCIPEQENESFMSYELDKYTTHPKLRLPSKSHVSSLDRYIQDKLSSRLLLTKNFKDNKVSSFQRRKLYDQNRRQKLKNSLIQNVQLCPQIFEVRYLTMLGESSDYRRFAVKETNTLGLVESDTVSMMTNTIKSQTDQETIEKQELSSTDVGVIQIFPNEELQENEEKDCKTLNQKVLKITETVDENLLNTTSSECKMFSQECSSCKNLTGAMDKPPKPLSKTQKMNSMQDGPLVKDKSSILKIEQLYSCNHLSSTSEKSPIESLTSEEILKINDSTASSFIKQSISCPVLNTKSSSCDFLYEDTPTDFLLSDLVNQFRQTFNQYNVAETSFLHNHELLIRATESVESGYGSDKSKDPSIPYFKSFFKKPYIAALFRVPIASRRIESRSEIFINRNINKEMMEKYHFYTRKVKLTGEDNINKNDNLTKSIEAKNTTKIGKLVVPGDGDDIKVTKNVYCEEIQVKEEDRSNSISSFKTNIEEMSSQKSLHDTQNGLEDDKMENVNAIACEQIEHVHILMKDKWFEYTVLFHNPSFDIFVSIYLKCEKDKPVNFASAINSDSDFDKDTIDRHFFQSLTKSYERETEISKKIYNDESFRSVLLSALKNHLENKKKSKLSRLRKIFGTTQEKMEGKTVVSEQVVEMKENVLKLEQLQGLAENARKCFIMLADAAKVNGNIDNELKICSLLKLLERIEKRDFQIFQCSGHDSEEQEIKRQILDSFLKIYEFCDKKAKKHKRRLSDVETELIRLLVTVYRIQLLTNVDLIPCYISCGIIQTEEQLKDAVTYLMRTKSTDFDVKEL